MAPYPSAPSTVNGSRVEFATIDSFADEKSRLRVDVHLDPQQPSTLAADVLRGLALPQKTLPPKHFYDDRGSRLFETICDLPEYYLTRTEQALLETVAEEIVALTRPRDLVEFGSGASRKTRVLLDALQRPGPAVRYVPMDVSESTLRRSAASLLEAYPALTIHAVVGDYERHLDRLPNGRLRLVAFLGSTIGNFTPAQAEAFLARVAAQLNGGDHLLLGVDVVKDPAVLHAAYNDAAGVTAEFNRNILRVVNRTLDGTFDPDAFEHVAFFDPQASQIEMHLRATQAHTVRIKALDLAVRFREGETIHTEISRKFTRPETDSLLRRTGFELVRWFEPANRYFALALARRG
ncbi:MAG TPA: L-histidine N(alpha)-methyltransferase [Candidatus Kryptonia bacterium]|nr:L-histidine N(alpha)-methyltransferase [Candidatus Kryptonia bacterium]